MRETKADIRAIRRFLVKLAEDERLTPQEQWLATQTLKALNESK